MSYPLWQETIWLTVALCTKGVIFYIQPSLVFPSNYSEVGKSGLNLTSVTIARPLLSGDWSKEDVPASF